MLAASRAVHIRKVYHARGRESGRHAQHRVPGLRLGMLREAGPQHANPQPAPAAVSASGAGLLNARQARARLPASAAIGPAASRLSA